MYTLLYINNSHMHHITGMDNIELSAEETDDWVEEYDRVEEYNRVEEYGSDALSGENQCYKEGDKSYVQWLMVHHPS